MDHTAALPGTTAKLNRRRKKERKAKEKEEREKDVGHFVFVEPQGSLRTAHRRVPIRRLSTSTVPGAQTGKRKQSLHLGPTSEVSC